MKGSLPNYSSSKEESDTLLLNDSLQKQGSFEDGQENTSNKQNNKNIHQFIPLRSREVYEGNTERFGKSRRQDLWCVIVVAILLLFFFILSILASPNKNAGSKSKKQLTFLFVIVTVIAMTIISFCLAYGWFFMINHYPRSIIKISLIFMVIALLVTSILMFIFHLTIIGFYFILFAIAFVITLILWKPRLSFSNDFLLHITDLLKNVPSIINISFFGFVSQAIWTILWVSFAYRIRRYDSFFWNFFSIYIFFSVSMVLKNIVHTTSSGIFASLYYNVDQTKKNIPISCFHRTIKYSIGSLCISSFVVPIVKNARAFCRTVLKNESPLIKHMFTCLLGISEWIYRYANDYAMVHISIYAKSHKESSMAVWKLLRESGGFVPINNDLIGNAIVLCSMISGMAVAFISLIFVGGRLEGSELFIFWSLLLLIGFFLTFVFIEPFFSAALTYYISFCESPEVLRENTPELYQKFREIYEFDF
ncbi:protein pns1 [Anaeramoeba flamelloides]|uniref:Choline transporter-like protein n=1 Tax=Anaeramoeba flamelloides TaxID=1746091 RepID=A0ABQ8XPH8_9EUKA|nr:protein pns1 [Anaeramoeba flamelloides]